MLSGYLMRIMYTPALECCLLSSQCLAAACSNNKGIHSSVFPHINYITFASISDWDCFPVMMAQVISSHNSHDSFRILGKNRGSQKCRCSLFLHLMIFFFFFGWEEGQEFYVDERVVSFLASLSSASGKTPC